MRIAYFTDGYLPGVNGVSYVVDTHARLLAENNQVEIFAPAYGWWNRNETGKNLKIFRYKSFPWPMYKDVHLAVPNIWKMIEEVNRFSPDVIHIHTPFSMGLSGILIAKLKKIPLVGTYHTLFSEVLVYVSPKKMLDKYLAAIEKAMTGVGVNIELRNLRGNGTGGEKLQQKMAWNMVNKIYGYCDAVICPTEAIKKELVKRRFNKKLWVISYGIDRKVFKPNGKLVKEKIILHSGRLAFEKNVDVVLKAFKLVTEKIPDSRLVIAGDGPANKSLKELARNLGLGKKVTWLGMVPRQRLPQIYQRAALFVTASTMETLGMVVLEALACGVPVVGVNKYALRDLILEDENGLIAEPGKPKALAAAMIKVLKDERLREKFSTGAIRSVQNHELDKTKKQLESLYRLGITGKG